MLLTLVAMKSELTPPQATLNLQVTYLLAYCTAHDSGEQTTVLRNLNKSTIYLYKFLLQTNTILINYYIKFIRTDL